MQRGYIMFNLKTESSGVTGRTLMIEGGGRAEK
jgi:hypothetical protein